MTGANKISLAECKTRALPVGLWPAADGGAWIEACQPPARLKPGGRAGHLRPTTRDHYAERYACFLGFLRRRGLLQSEGAPAANVTPDKVDAYLADLKDRVASTTMHDSIATLRLVAKIIAPGGDFRWLSEIAQRSRSGEATPPEVRPRRFGRGAHPGWPDLNARGRTLPNHEGPRASSPVS